MAARYWIGGGTNSNWNASPTTNWAATSGGAVRVAAPTSADDVFFDGAGANGNTNSIISAGLTVLSLTITAGYTSTITHNGILTIAGTVWTMHNGFTIAGSSAINLTGSITITSGGKTWPNNLTSTGNNTKTLVGDLIVLGTISNGNATNLTINSTTSETLSCNGFATGTGGSYTGSAKIILTGGTWNMSSAVANNIDIQGNVTFTGTCNLTTQLSSFAFTLTYVSGTVTTTGSTLRITGTSIRACTLNTNGVDWNIITFIDNLWVITINSTLTCSTMNMGSVGSSITFQGTDGFTISTLSHTGTTTGTITLQEGVTYTITSSIVANFTRVGSILLFTSSHASNKAILTLREGATCAVLANFTRIDASGGRPIRSFNGTITDCNNIISFYDLKSVAA